MRNILSNSIRHSALDAESPAKMRLRVKPAMTKNTLLIVYLLCVFMTGSCQKPRPPEPPEPPRPQPTFPTKLEIVWNAPFFSDSTYDYFWDYEIANNQYIMLANIYDRTYNKPRGIGVYNMQTGERHSAWQNDPGGIFAATEYEMLQDCKVAGKNKDIILIYSKDALFGYSLHSGQRLWTVTIRNPIGIPHMSANIDYAFINYGNPKSWGRLAMVDVYSGEKRDILRINIEDNYEFTINPPSFYVSNGDTLLYFTTDGWNFEEVKGNSQAYCYNLTQKQMLWVNKQDLSPDGASASQPPPFVIENDKLIVTERKAISCLNKHTGELIWQREGLGGISDTPPLYHEGRLYIRHGFLNSISYTLLCLDAQSGQMLWENTTTSPRPAFHGAMAIYKDRLYFSISEKSLVCVDIHTGQELWRDKGPYGGISYGVLIDQKTGYLYCNTGWSTLCVDLNKTPKK